MVDSAGGRRGASQVGTWSPQAARPGQLHRCPSSFLDVMPRRLTRSLVATRLGLAAQFDRVTDKTRKASPAGYQDAKCRRESPATGPGRCRATSSIPGIWHRIISTHQRAQIPVQLVYVIPSPDVANFADLASEIVNSDDCSTRERQVDLIFDSGKPPFFASPLSA